MSTKIPIRFLDAGLGTTLELPPHNAKFREGSSLWSSDFLISSPDTLSGVHKAFVDAGADVILTATYQASLEGFAATEKLPGDQTPSATAIDNGSHCENQPASNGTYNPEEATAFMRKAVPLAKEAITSRQHNGAERTSKGVALSLGAYGATMQPSTEYSGEYKPEPMKTVQGLHDWHDRRFKIFHDDKDTWDNVDYVSFETLPVLQEVQAVRQIMAKHNNKCYKEWWISCVFPNDDLTLPDGSPVSAVIEAMLQKSDPGKGQRPWGIGINCTDIKKLNDLILQYESNAKRVLSPYVEKADGPWLVLYPDGAQGSVYNTETQGWEIDPEMKAKGPQRSWHEELAEIIIRTAERGRWHGILVGGCCKTTPDDIKKLRAQLASATSDAYYLETG
ncbi:MAG: hypothetical protein Q9218_001797 [Villophora microphyllina]